MFYWDHYLCCLIGNSALFAWLECIVGCFYFLLNLNASLGVSILCSVWMHCQVFLFLIQLEGIVECFCSLFNFNVSFSVSIHFFNVIALLCVCVCVFFFAQLEWIVECFCSFFDFNTTTCLCPMLGLNASLGVYVPCLAWVHHHVFLFLVWL